MATKLYQSWLAVIAEFLVEIWSAEEFSKENAECITKWSIHEMVPSTPQTLPGSLRVTMGELTARALVTFTLIQSSTEPKVDKMVAMMRVVRESLNIENSDFEKIVMRIVHGKY